MNPYRQIDRLEKKVKRLTEENEKLKAIIAEGEYTYKSSEAKLKATEKLEGEYYKLIEELRQEQEEYQEILKAIRIAQRDMTRAYKKIT